MFIHHTFQLELFSNGWPCSWKTLNIENTTNRDTLNKLEHY